MTGAMVGKASSPDIVMNTVGAKAAWLSKLDTPSWGTKAGFMNPAPAAATIAAAPSEDAAKAAWLAKLDTPVWGRAAAPTPTIDAAAAATNEAAAKAAWLAKLDTPVWGRAAAPTPTNEAAAKAAWLAKLNAPAWGQGRATPAALYSEPVSDASFSYNAAPVDTTAAVTAEAAAKAAWLAKLDTPVWGRAAAPTPPNEAAAQAAWLAKLDAPAWGQGRVTPAALYSEPVSDASFSYNAAPVDTTAAVTAEAAAKAAWLAKLDTPAWGRSEAAAKAAWLAKLDAPVWGRGLTTPIASHYSEPAADASVAAATREAAAKAAWLAKLDLAAATTAEAFAKAAWLAERDAFFGATHASAPAPVALAPAYTAPARASTNEAAAKAAWLAKLDAPAWGASNVPAPAGRVVPTRSLPSNYAPAFMPNSAPVVGAESAKAAWLAKLDAPSWAR